MDLPAHILCCSQNVSSLWFLCTADISDNEVFIFPIYSYLISTYISILKMQSFLLCMVHSQRCEFCIFWHSWSLQYFVISIILTFQSLVFFVGDQAILQHTVIVFDALDQVIGAYCLFLSICLCTTQCPYFVCIFLVLSSVGWHPHWPPCHLEQEASDNPGMTWCSTNTSCLHLHG